MLHADNILHLLPIHYPTATATTDAFTLTVPNTRMRSFHVDSRSNEFETSSVSRRDEGEQDDADAVLNKDTVGLKVVTDGLVFFLI
jgi:hypothetical protein